MANLRDIPRIEQALVEVEALLRGWFSAAQRRDAATGAPESDAVFSAMGASWAVVYLNTSTAAALGLARKRLEDAAPARRVVAVPYMTDAGKQFCTSHSLCWLDLAGNADLSADGVRIYVQGRPNPFETRGKRGGLFSAKAARVARTLLLHPEQPWRQRDLATAAALSEGYVSEVVNRYIRQGWVLRDDENRVHLADAERLLRTWHLDASAPRVAREGYVPMGSGPMLTRALIDALSAHGTYRIYATGLAAAWSYAPHASYRRAQVYVQPHPTQAVLDELGWREDSGAPNVVLLALTTPDRDESDGNQIADGIPCVSPFQAYVDLRHSAERAEEAAAHLLDHLRPSFHDAGADPL